MGIPINPGLPIKHSAFVVSLLQSFSLSINKKQQQQISNVSYLSGAESDEETIKDSHHSTTSAHQNTSSNSSDQNSIRKHQDRPGSFSFHGLKGTGAHSSLSLSQNGVVNGNNNNQQTNSNDNSKSKSSKTIDIEKNPAESIEILRQGILSVFVSLLKVNIQIHKQAQTSI